MTTPFPWKKIDAGRETTIKWTVNNAKYEIYSSELDTVDLSILIAHCLDVRNKVLSVVNVDAHKAKSLMRVFPRTIWDNIVAEFAEDVEDPDVDGFLKQFIAAHATPEDRHELLTQLRTAHKAREIGVQQFYYRLLEVNGYVDWLPGTEAALQPEELCQAFHGAMPTKWKEVFTKAGKSIHDMSFAEVVRDFRSQENMAVRKQAENEAANRSKSSRTPNGDNKKAYGKRKFRPSSDKNDNKKPRGAKKRIEGDSDCPIHPGLHKWAKCYENIRNKDSPLKDKVEKKPSFDNNKKKTTQFTIEAVKELDSNSDTEAELQRALKCKSIFYDEYPVSYTEVIAHSFACSDITSQIDEMKMYDSFNAYVQEQFVEGNDQQNYPSDNVINTFLLHTLKPIGL